MQRELRFWRALAGIGLVVGLFAAGMSVGEARAEATTVAPTTLAPTKVAQKAAPAVVCKKVSFPKYNDAKYYKELNAQLLAEHGKGYRLIQLVPWMFASVKPNSAMACFEKMQRAGA